MNRKKRWLIIIVVAIAATAYFFLFFKTYNEKGVVSNADHIISFDKKRITNTVIWTYITTPSLWNAGKIFTSSGDVDWKDMVIVPDYVFIFHIKDQPLNAWYTVLEVKHEEDFAGGLKKYGFVNIPGTQRYASKQLGIEFIRFNNKLLIGNAAVDNRSLIAETAQQLFVQKKYINRSRLTQVTAIAEHLAWSFDGNALFKNITGGASFTSNSITVSAEAFINKSLQLTQVKFDQPRGFLVSAGFVQPPKQLYDLFTDSLKQNASRWLNFNIDSLLLPANRYYQAGIKNFISRTDTAISYAYDSDFNQVESKVINKILEPSFFFEVYGDDVADIYHYWERNKNMERTAEGNLFTSMPFVKSYASIEAGSRLGIYGYNYIKPVETAVTDSCFLYVALDALQIPDSLMKYIPAQMAPVFKKAGSIFISAKCKAKEELILHARIDKRKGEEWF